MPRLETFLLALTSPLVLFALLFALALLPADAQEPAAATAPPKVDLDSSFVIPTDSHGRVSHVPAVLFTRDGKRLVTGTSQGEVLIWDTATRKILSRARYSESALVAVALDPEARWLAWSGADGTLEVRPLEGGATPVRLAQVGARQLAISPDGRFLAVGRGHVVEIRNVVDLSLARTAPEGAGDVTNLAWSPDGKRLATTGQDGVVRLFAFPELAPLWQIAKQVPMFALAFSPDGKYLAYGGQDNKLYQADPGAEQEEVISKNQPYWITTIGYSPDRKSVAIGDESCDVWIYDLASRECIFHSKHHNECWLNSCAWSPDSETFLFGCRPNAHAGAPAIWTANTLVEANNDPAVQGYEARIRDLRGRFVKLSEDPRFKELRGRLEGLLAARAQALAEEMKRRGVTGASAVPMDLNGRLASVVDAGAPRTASVLESDIAFVGTFITGYDAAAAAQGDTVGGLDVLGNSMNGNGAARRIVPTAQSEELTRIDAELKEIDAKLMAAPEVQEVKQGIEKLRTEQQAALKQKCEELDRSFCINQWKLRR